MNHALDQLVRRLALAFNLDEALLTKSGHVGRTAMAAKRIGMWYVRNTWTPQPSYPEIATMFGVKSHKSAIYAMTYAARQMANDTEIGRIAKKFKKIFYLPVPHRERTQEEDARLDAAAEWLLSELKEPAGIDVLRALAEKELARPRDALHRIWAETFLAETASYGAL